MNTTALEKIQAAFPDAICKVAVDSVVIDVQPEDLENTLSRLKNDADLNCGLLVDVTAIDYLQYPKQPEARYTVVYTLRNWEENLLIQVRTPVADPEQPLEIIRTIHSFDPCIACAVHLYDEHGKHISQVQNTTACTV